MKEIVYSCGEVGQLLKATIRHLRDIDFGPDRDAITNLMAALKRISKAYRTMSEVFLEVSLKKCKGYCSDNNKENYEKIMKEIFWVLFQEDLMKIPLLINTPVIGYLAKFRLQVGR